MQSKNRRDYFFDERGGDFVGWAIVHQSRKAPISRHLFLLLLFPSLYLQYACRLNFYYALSPFSRTLKEGKKKIVLPFSELASYHRRIFLLFSGRKRISFYCMGSRTSRRMRNLGNSGRPPLNLNVIWNQLSSGKKQKLIDFVVGFFGLVFKLLSSTQL